MVRMNWGKGVRTLARMTAIGGVITILAGCETTSQSVAGGQDGLYESGGVQKTLFEAAREAEKAKTYETAAGIYGRLYEVRPHDPNVLAAFVRNMRYSGRSREVVGYVESKTPHMLTDFGVKFEYAKALLTARRKNDALVALNEVNAQKPGDWQVYSAIGITHDALGQYGEAITAYRGALELSPGNVVVMNNMAMSQAMSGHLADAIGTLEKAAGINRTNMHVRQNLALLYAINGDVDRARALASMDLGLSDLETNLSFYRRFEGQH